VGVTPEERRDLLGAFALDALDPEETAAVEAWLALDPDAAAEADRLRRAASWLGATEALAPPARLRDSLLRRAGAVRDGVDGPLAAYRSEVERFDALVSGLPERVLDRPTWNGLTIRALVAHCAAMETAVAQTVGLPSPVDAPDGVEERTRVFVDALRNRPIDDARALWRDAAGGIEAWAAAGGERAGYPWLGTDAPRDDVLVARAFEIWTHADDIRRALDRELEPPDGPVVSEMSALSVRLLASGLALHGRERPGRLARVVLTGPGGGDWMLGLTHHGEFRPARAGERSDVTLTADVLDWCHVVGERLAPDALDLEVEGDAALAEELLGVASTFATL
jgi:uncharacterized protein (TIGR03083 family)